MGTNFKTTKMKPEQFLKQELPHIDSQQDVDKLDVFQAMEYYAVDFGEWLRKQGNYAKELTIEELFKKYKKEE